MDVLLAVVEVLGVAFDGCLGLAELVGLAADAVAWFESRENRRQRRDARRAGAPVPSRSVWTWAFILLTSGVVLLFAFVVGLAVIEKLR